ncbi:hypothetical protein MTP09_07815 [Chryseobacterium suipulveris]|uniref:DUF304 domain-containing protein n=1 Tax=Chryseobacterium suipulveris TaxID=2929800 RepID=A0ABY4BKW2_9FLAO|nr:hypothetical protein [Chryseobacterium suipulveris]UOE39833.1 hypothetical protein MTP09_07815 [Chryseobacterium suipulveris]
MRLSNRKKTGIYRFIGSAILMMVFLGVAAFLLERYIFDVSGWGGGFFIIIPLLLLYVFYLRGRQIFEYDSDGEVLNFKNRGIWSLLRTASDEFPKYKLLKYEVVDALLFKRLFITISSKKSHSTILKYDISYLTRKEIHDLKLSLSRVIKANKEREKVS